MHLNIEVSFQFRPQLLTVMRVINGKEMLVKVLHMGVATVILGLLLFQLYLVVRNKPLVKGVKIVQHMLYAFIMLTGIAMAMVYPYIPHWLIAKIILFIVVISALTKASRMNSSPVQRKLGVFIAVIAYAGIVILVLVKPAGLWGAM